MKIACEEKPERNAISLKGNLPAPIMGTSNNDGFFVGSIAGVAHR